MSWIEDHECELLEAEAIEENEIYEIQQQLTDLKLDSFNEYLKENYVGLVCNIMSQYEQKGSISDKQKYCIAKYILKNDLSNKLDIRR